MPAKPRSLPPARKLSRGPLQHGHRPDVLCPGPGGAGAGAGHDLLVFAGGDSPGSDKPAFRRVGPRARWWRVPDPFGTPAGTARQCRDAFAGRPLRHLRRSGERLCAGRGLRNRRAQASGEGARAAVFAPPVCKVDECPEELDVATRYCTEMTQRRMEQFRSIEECADFLNDLSAFHRPVPGIRDLYVRTILRECGTNRATCSGVRATMKRRCSITPGRSPSWWISTSFGARRKSSAPTRTCRIHFFPLST